MFLGLIFVLFCFSVYVDVGCPNFPEKSLAGFVRHGKTWYKDGADQHDHATAAGICATPDNNEFFLPQITTDMDFHYVKHLARE